MRLIVTLFLSAASVILLFGWGIEVADSCGINLFPSLRQRNEALSRLRSQRDDFEPRLSRIIDELAVGRLSLREATRAIEACAVVHHPTFLEYVDIVEMSGGIHTKIAGNLLRNFRRPPDGGACGIDARRLEQLTREFSEIAASEAATP